MAFFRKTRKPDGSLAFAVQGDGVAVARVTRSGGGRPAVALAAWYPGAAAPEALEKAGRELRAAAFECSTVLAGGQYQMLAVDAPNVPPDELRTAVRWRLKDMLDFHVDDATIDVLDIPVERNGAARIQHSMFAVAARNSLIEQRQKLFSAARIGLAAIDIPEMAQRNISAMLEPEGRGLAMLSFGADGGLLTVSFGAELYLSRRIDVTLEQLLDADHERKHQSFDKITLELQRSLDHFERQFHFISVARLVLVPSTVVGLDAYLSSNLYTPVDTLDLADLFDLTAVPELAGAAQQQRFFIALGAALRHEERAASQQINLFNPVFLQQKKLFAANTMAQALGVLLLGVLLLAAAAQQRVAGLRQEAAALARQVQKKQARLASVTAQYAPRQPSGALATEVASAEAELAGLRNVDTVIQRGALGNTRGYAETFRALARQHVDGLWLTGVSIAGVGAEMTVQGRALAADQVPGYLARLTREPVLQGKSFGTLRIGQPAAPAAPGKAAPPLSFVEFSLQSGGAGDKP